MKRMDLFCSSPASTAVISSKQGQSSTVRRNRKSYTLLSPVPCSCSSLPPINPKPSHQKHTKTSANNKQNHSRKSYVQLKDKYNRHSNSSSSTHLLSDSDTNSSFIHSNRSPTSRPSSSSSPRSRNQVVILRVSLHCRGCAAKVGRHISKMQGVTSFCIEMESKKVTIVGDVTPLGVLASISKVKNAQLWPSSSSSSMPMVGV